MGPYVLVIDQGTTSSRAIVFDADQQIAGMGVMEFTQHYPKPDWVEHNPEEIWATCLWACKTAIRKAALEPGDISAIGITNQRETTVIWDRTTGRAIHNAIVWQDRRMAKLCERLKKKGVEKTFTKKTGLVLDPYFSGPKAKWLLDNVPAARKRARKGELAFGTIDSFLIWRLTGGRVHATDATNASRTLLYNIEKAGWDPELLDMLDIPAAILPEVKDSADDFGTTDPAVLGAAIPIYGVAGDQQAAMIGQACFEPGMLKATMGSSCFALLNTGSDLVRSRNRLLSTVAYRLNGKTTYALEGVIYTMGGAVSWLTDEIGILDTPADSGRLAQEADDEQDVYMVPAFVGLAAPYWDTEARAAIFGLRRDSRRAELARAALEAVGYQTRDLIDAMRRDWKRPREMVLRVDGGMVVSDWTMQRLADLAEVAVERPTMQETTALGVAWLAGWRAGIWPDARGFSEMWALDRRFAPQMDDGLRKRKLRGWKDAVRRTLSAA